MGKITDLIFLCLGKAGRWFNVKGQRVYFILWFICVAYWTARNLIMGLIVQSLGCVVSMGFRAYGYWNWKNKGIGN